MSGSAALQADMRAALRQMIDQAPGGAPLERSVPVIEAPSLDNLEVTMPAPEPVTEKALLARFAALKRELATEVPRAEVEAVALGDEVLIDCVGYVRGRILPFSMREDLWYEMSEDDAYLPGMVAGLAGTPVGGSKSVTIVFPDDYPVERHRGITAVFAVMVKAARTIVLPEENDAFILALERGYTLEEVFVHLANELTEEQDEEALHAGKVEVLAEVARRAIVDVPAAVIDEEIRAQWRAAEDTPGNAERLMPDELVQSMDGWISDPELRSEQERRYRLAAAMRAIALRDDVKLGDDALETFVDTYAKSMDLTVAEVAATLASDHELRGIVRRHLLYQVQVEHLFSRATVLPG